MLCSHFAWLTFPECRKHVWAFVLTLSCLNHWSPFFTFSLSCHPLRNHACTIHFILTLLIFGTVMSILFPFLFTVTSFLFPCFLLSLSVTLLGLFLSLGSFFAIMPPFPLSFGGCGVFAFDFCTHCCIHRAPCSGICIHTGKCVNEPKQKQTLKVVKLLVKIFYLATVMTALSTTMSGGIAATNNVEYNTATNNVEYDTVVFCNVKDNNVVFCNVKYDNVGFCLQQHPANSIMRLIKETFYGVYILYSISAPN